MLCRRIVFCILLTAITFPASTFADTIILKNGTTLRGRVVGQDYKMLVLEPDIEGNQAEVVQKKDIFKLIYNDGMREEAERRRREAELAKQRDFEKAELEKRKSSRNFDDSNLQSGAQDGRPKRPDVTTAGILWRSAILPGWGHLKADETFLGSMYMGLFLAAAANAASRYQVLQSRKSDYTENIDRNITPLCTASASQPLLGLTICGRQNTDAFQHYKKAQQDFNLAVGAIAGIYIIQLVHALITGTSLDDTYAAQSRGNYNKTGWNVYGSLQNRSLSEQIKPNAYNFGLSYTFMFDGNFSRGDDHE
ncbi:MAG: hypothetical protein K8R21_13945 [Leptospira sp.]|nr:hypothetical protein [Leptospira sp.]